MTLLWAVPLLALVVALVVVVSRLRALEDLAVDLGREVRRSRELRPPIRAVRRELDRSEALVDRVWSHWDDGDDHGEVPVSDDV